MSPVDQPQPNHPLTAIRRQGVVQDVSQFPLVGCYIGGDTTTVVLCTVQGRYLPVVGDTVLLLENQGDYIVTDALGKFYFEQWDYNGFSVPNNGGYVTPQNQTFLVSAYGSAWSGAQWTAPVAGVYTWTIVGHPLAAATFRAIVQFESPAATTVARTDLTGVAGAQWATLSYTMWFPVGQTAKVNFFQNTGAGQVQDAASRVSVLLH